MWRFAAGRWNSSIGMASKFEMFSLEASHGQVSDSSNYSLWASPWLLRIAREKQREVKAHRAYCYSTAPNHRRCSHDAPVSRSFVEPHLVPGTRSARYGHRPRQGHAGIHRSAQSRWLLERRTLMKGCPWTPNSIAQIGGSPDAAQAGGLPRGIAGQPPVIERHTRCTHGPPYQRSNGLCSRLQQAAAVRHSLTSICAERVPSRPVPVRSGIKPHRREYTEAPAAL